MSAQGYSSPLVVDAHSSQLNKSPPVVKTAPSEKEENNATNSQRRSPCRSDLKRYYTIGHLALFHIPPIVQRTHGPNGHLPLQSQSPGRGGSTVSMGVAMVGGPALPNFPWQAAPSSGAPATHYPAAKVRLGELVS
ncbi:UNVERIFIED_CONTAM: hypothetical protein FKN15_039651 [Acipenser sinensis]